MDFLSWFRSHGGYLNSSVELASDNDSQYSLVVRQSCTVHPDEKIVSCPHDITLSIATARESRRTRGLPPLNTSALSRSVAFRLCLVDEYLLGEKSFWWPYLQHLPQPYRKDSFHTPAYFDEQDMLWLEGTNLGHAAKTRIKVWKDEFEEAIKALQETDEECGRPWTSDLYIWAATIITSRGFPASATSYDTLGLPVLIPGLDFLNHSPSAKVIWDWGPKHCAIIVVEEGMEGCQVTNNYGPKSNEELLMGYGFCLDPNYADTYNLSYTRALEQRIIVERRESLLDFQQRNDSRPARSHPNVDSDLPRDIHHVCLIIPSSEELCSPSTSFPSYAFSPGLLTDFSLVLRNARERRSPDHMDMVPSRDATSFSTVSLSRLKLHVLATLLMILEDRQKSIQKHDGSLPKHPRGRNQEYAAIYRASQLQILKGALHGLRNDLLTLTGRPMIDVLVQPGTQPKAFAGSKRPDLSRIIRLIDILASSTDSAGTSDSGSKVVTRITHDLRAVINAGLGTRNPEKIVKQGGEEFAFTMWLYGLFLLYSDEQREKAKLKLEVNSKYLSNEKREKEIMLADSGDLPEAKEPTVASGEDDTGKTVLPTWVQKWFDTLHSWYSFQGSSSSSSRPGLSDKDPVNVSNDNIYDRVEKHEAQDQITPATATTTIEEDEITQTAQTYVHAIQATVQKHPNSIFNRMSNSSLEPESVPTISLERLIWCLNVVRGEGVRCPFPDTTDSEGREEGRRETADGDDEFVIVVEC